MSSFYFEDHLDHVTSVNLSQNSADLFEESPQSNCSLYKTPRNRISFSKENSSETSEECSIPRRRPRKALSVLRYSDDSSSCNNNRCSGGLENGNKTSSILFRPISPHNKTCESDSNSLLEIKQSKFYSPLKSAACRLSKENVEATHVSESNHSDSSSILDDSFDYGSCNQSSKKSFKTPIYSSVKKRIIHQWLTNVSLNCSLKPEVIDPRSEGHSLDLAISEKPNVSEISGSNLKDEFNKSDVGELASVTTFHNPCDSNATNKDYSKNDYSWLYEVHSSFQDRSLNDTYNMTANMSAVPYCQRKSNEKDVEKVLAESEKNISSKSKNSSCLMQTCYEKENHDSSGVESISAFSDNSDSCLITKQFKPSKNLDKCNKMEAHENSEGHLKRTDLQTSGYNQNIACSESGDESDSSFEEVRHEKFGDNLDDDDSLINVRFSKKSRNCLNISSDDSEAKDTANDSEDIPNHVVDPYTPKRRLYFRNPLNNSLDDDAKPIIYGKNIKIHDNVNRKSTEKNVFKTKDLLAQICSEVDNFTMKNEEISFTNNNLNYSRNNIENDFNSEQSINNKSLEFNSEKVLTSENILQSNSTLFRNQPNCSDDQFDASITNLEEDSNDISSNNLSKNTSLEIKNENEVRSSSDVNKSFASNIHEFISNTQSEFNDSADSVLLVKRKSKRNVLNYSTDEDLPNSNEASFNRIKVPNSESSLVKGRMEGSSSSAKVVVDLTASDNEYDKYIYRTRSDSSCSEGSSVICEGGVSEDVITIQTTSCEEEANSSDDSDSPWFDLESYLKKNVPASSKSLESSFFKNVEKRKAQLAKMSLPTHSSCPDHASFLLSLTPRVPDEMCHPEATKYRGDYFSKNKNELVNLLFKLFNKDIFDEKLPPLEITWSGHLTTTSGITKSSSKITKHGKIRSSCIKLSKTIVDDASKLRDVLLHELCHAANWLIDEQAAGHGPLFKKWVNKIWIKYPEIPKVKTTHRYELKWKYLYKCSYCGYELGKMKLSLEETSCRLCGGLVTVNT